MTKGEILLRMRELIERIRRMRGYGNSTVFELEKFDKELTEIETEVAEATDHYMSGQIKNTLDKRVADRKRWKL